MHRRHPPVADAPMHPFKRVTKGADIPQHAVATAQRVRYKGSGLNRIKRLIEAAPKNLALFVCVVVIKCANEDIGERDHENISRGIINASALMRITPCAFAQWMCWHILLFSTWGPI
jgi:hypothetical protein